MGQPIAVKTQEEQRRKKGRERRGIHLQHAKIRLGGEQQKREANAFRKHDAVRINVPGAEIGKLGNKQNTSQERSTRDCNNGRVDSEAAHPCLSSTGKNRGDKQS